MPDEFAITGRVVAPASQAAVVDPGPPPDLAEFPDLVPDPDAVFVHVAAGQPPLVVDHATGDPLFSFVGGKLIPFAARRRRA